MFKWLKVIKSLYQSQKRLQLIEIVRYNFSMSPDNNIKDDSIIIVGDETLPIVDFAKMSRNELKTYLGEEFSISHKLTKPELLRMAINTQLTAIII